MSTRKSVNTKQSKSKEKQMKSKEKQVKAKEKKIKPRISTNTKNKKIYDKKGGGGEGRKIIFFGDNENFIDQESNDPVTLEPLFDIPGLCVYIDNCGKAHNSSMSLDSFQSIFKQYVTYKLDDSNTEYVPHIFCVVSGERIPNPKIYPFFTSQNEVPENIFIELKDIIGLKENMFVFMYRTVIEKLKLKPEEIPETERKKYMELKDPTTILGFINMMKGIRKHAIFRELVQLAPSKEHLYAWIISDPDRFIYKTRNFHPKKLVNTIIFLHKLNLDLYPEEEYTNVNLDEEVEINVP
jgi:hypothetical protein